MPPSERKQKADTDRVLELLRRATQLAREYYELTGRPLGITGEVAEFEAVRLIPRLKLAPPRQLGYDATRTRGGRTEHIQIKGRQFSLTGSRKTQRTGAINVNNEWDVLMLVLLNERFETVEIHEIARELVVAEIKRPGSKARARGQLSISWLKQCGQQVWPELRSPSRRHRVPATKPVNPSRPGSRQRLKRRVAPSSPIRVRQVVAGPTIGCAATHLSPGGHWR